MKKYFLSFLIGATLAAAMPLSIVTFHELATRDVSVSSDLTQFEIHSYSQPDVPDQSGTARFVKNLTNDIRFNPKSFHLLFAGRNDLIANRTKQNTQLVTGSTFSPQHSSLEIPLFIQFRTLII